MVRRDKSIGEIISDMARKQLNAPIQTPPAVDGNRRNVRAAYDLAQRFGIIEPRHRDWSSGRMVYRRR